MANSPFKQGALTPTKRKPRDGRVSPVVNTMAKTMPDAPKIKPTTPVQPVDYSGPVGRRTSKARPGAKVFGQY